MARRITKRFPPRPSAYLVLLFARCTGRAGGVFTICRHQGRMVFWGKRGAALGFLYRSYADDNQPGSLRQVCDSLSVEFDQRGVAYVGLYHLFGGGDSSVMVDQM